MDVRVKFGGSRSNSGVITVLVLHCCYQYVTTDKTEFAGRNRFMHFWAVFNCFFAADRKQLLTPYPSGL